MRRSKVGVAALAGALVALSAGLGLAAPAGAPPGALDRSFSGDGMATVDFGGKDDYTPTDMVLQPNGALVLVGDTNAVADPSSGRVAFAIARVRRDGSLDPSFSGDGKQVVQIGPVAAASAVALQRDGKIVVAGSGGSGPPEFALTRLNPNGSVDPTFGSGGVAGVAFGTRRSDAYDVAVQPNGKIVVVGAGAGADAKFPDFAIARLNPDGSLDSTFNGDGKQTLGFGAADSANSVAIQPDGKIVVAGSGDANNDMVAIRLNADGSIDKSFGSGGIVAVDFGGDDGANDVALQRDGRIVLAGYGRDAASNSTDFAIARLNPDGSLDSTFSGDGKQTVGFGADDQALGVVIQANGRIVLGGEGDVNQDLILTRLNPDGSLDESFGSHDAVGIDFGGNEFGGALALRPDGRIAISGTTTQNEDFALAQVIGDPVGRAASAATLTTTMLGKNEGSKGAPTGSGKAVIRLDPVKGTVCWTFSRLKGLDEVTAAHIHRAPQGKAGPIVVPFFAGALRAKGCVRAKASLINAIEKHPTLYYVNIHTVKYPAGAIRGQL